CDVRNALARLQEFGPAPAAVLGAREVDVREAPAPPGGRVAPVVPSYEDPPLPRDRDLRQPVVVVARIPLVDAHRHVPRRAVVGGCDEHVAVVAGALGASDAEPGADAVAAHGAVEARAAQVV